MVVVLPLLLPLATGGSRKRAEEAELTNIVVKLFTFTTSNQDLFIEEISSQVGSVDLGIGLHSCGTFTDIVMEVCR